MDKTALVTTDLATGESVLKALEGAGNQVAVALWLHTPEYEDWRLVLSSPQLDKGSPRQAYEAVHDVLRKAGLRLEQMPPLLLFETTDPFIRGLRRLFGQAASTEGMRLGGQLIGDRFISDAYVYRIR